MTENSTYAKAASAAKPQTPAKPQARLILQDPLAYDQATQPSLRSSSELTAEPSAAALDREKAREIWENLSLDPEVALQRQAERKKLLLQAENAAKESLSAKAQVVQLQTQLASAKEERFHHPVVYVGALGLVGLGGLWVMERRKRIQAQERELEMMAAQSPSLAFDDGATYANTLAKTRANDAAVYLPQQGSSFLLEDSPDLANEFATDLSGLPEAKKVPDLVSMSPLEPLLPSERISISIENEQSATPPSEQTQRSPASISASKDAPVAALPAGVKAANVDVAPAWARAESSGNQRHDGVERSSEAGLVAMSKRVLGNMLRRRNELGSTSALPSHLDAPVSIHPSTAAPSTLIHEHVDDATQMLYDEEAQEAFEQELLAQQLSAGLHAGYDPDRANIELLSQTRASPQSGESAMEHLLELRTAVSGLFALGRPEGAAKLLEEHIEADPSTCAWGYLEYMHLCEQIGWREEFESMRKRYRQQFNRMAPYWHEPNSHVLGLDGYARAATELCAAWSQGIAHSHNTLSAWLVGPLLGRKLVQLPAYHDLFDLYEMLEFVDVSTGLDAQLTSAKPNVRHASLLNADLLLVSSLGLAASTEAEQEFVPTVSLLDLDYEFSSDVTLQEKEVLQSEKAVTIVKTGNFSVDFNVAGTQMGVLSSLPADLAKK